MSKEVIIVGPLPPPFGGISTHIQRLLVVLTETDISPTVINQYGAPKVSVIVRIFKALLQRKVVHLHLYHRFLFLLAALSRFVGRKGQLIITIHNDRLNNSLIWLTAARLAAPSQLIVVSERALDVWRPVVKCPVVHIPAFIEPKTISELSSGDKRCIANIWSYYGPESIKEYGLDIFRAFSQRLRSIPFVLYLGSTDASPELEDYFSREPNVRIVHGTSLVDEFNTQDILLRLNRVDAYGVSIAEALCLGVPTLASTACSRPPGCYVYVSIEEAWEHLMVLLSSPRGGKQGVHSDLPQPISHCAELVDLYRATLNKLE